MMKISAMVTILVLALVLPSVLASMPQKMPQKGDHVKILTNGNGIEGSDEGIVLEPDALFNPSSPSERYLKMNVTEECTGFNGWHCWNPAPSNTVYVPWKIIYNITWIN